MAYTNTWYKIGTVTATNGSTALTGASTWVGNALPGEGVVIGGDVYEIASVNSDTSITLARATSPARPLLAWPTALCRCRVTRVIWRCRRLSW
jgi:hypothetical protein